MKAGMKAGVLVAMGLIAWVTPALANCDLTRFRWGCDLLADITAKPYVSSLVYCLNTPLFVSQEQYDLLLRYQRANVNMNVLLNGEFVEGPCLPGRR